MVTACSKQLTTDTPPFFSRILFKIFDGLFWSDPAYVTVSIQPVNDNPPELSLVPVGMAYIEGTTEGVELLSNVILTDTDHNTVFNLTALHVSY